MNKIAGLVLMVGLFLGISLGVGFGLAQDDHFDPGLIINDATFSNSDSMTVSQIQAFLEARVKDGGCQRTLENDYSISQGYQPPWTCLFEFQQNPTTKAHNYGQFDSDGYPLAVEGGQTAAQIIHQAGADHRINPQVILAILQKEQSLVTDNWPWPSQYSRATNFCPTVTDCSDDSFDFVGQVNGLARQLRSGVDNPATNSFALGLNQIQYHPDSRCGLATIEITNLATASLYNHDPYTPNQAALDNLYGQGDSCSSYGLRNLWLHFKGWFSYQPVIPAPTPTPAPTPITIDPPQRSDVVGAQFNPGYIISDDIFTDTTTMTADQIDAFLRSAVKGGVCDRWRVNDWLTYRLENNIGNYQPPPWTCLFEFQQNPVTGDHNFGRFDQNDQPLPVEGGQTAGQIIYQAAIDHQINPQVLIVLLEKEQSLVTDDWPWPRQYSKATGWDCPDTRPCDPADASFYLQIQGAARGLRGYIDNLDRYWYQIGANDILYHPNQSCGTKAINIHNAATVALYLYTPYTPNQAALDNLRGEGDKCSAYGNRNFWVYFNDWFGSPTGDGPPTIVQPPTDPSNFDSFDPGLIINDATFSNSDSMTVSQIQAFLEARVKDGGCQRTLENDYSISQGYQPPWTCLFEFQQNPTTKAHNYGQFDSDGYPLAVEGGQTAAQIIHQAGADHRINPQVILAILQKEQSLVTDNWPWPSQYSRATNFCPTVTDCSDDSFDFVGQVNGLARQLRSGVDNPATNSFALGLNQIQYHPDSRCGLATIEITNLATASLYNHDPYTPNQAALDDLYGQGDSCSSYGLRNLWLHFKGWFVD